MGGFNWQDLMMDTDSSKGASGSDVFKRLPPELVAKILSKLPGKDIVKASRVCKSFHDASRIDLVWQERCLKEFNVSLPPKSTITAFQLYTKILHKYGKLLGFWRTDISQYGGLLQVKMENECLVGIEWHPPSFPNLKDPLRRKVLFSAEVTPDNVLQIYCQKGKFGRHKCLLETKESDKKFYTKCCSPECHDCPTKKQQVRLSTDFREWLQEETLQTLDRHAEELLLMKYLNVREYRNNFEHTQLIFPPRFPNVVIQPGLFVGSYSSHGHEIIMLTYHENTAKATKITGDPNVPCGKITFICDMRKHLTLDTSEQQRLSEMQKTKPVLATKPVIEHNSQPFRVPDDCIIRDHSDTLPDSCMARYHATGQVAGHGFTHPSYLGGHWIIFNENLFGFLWFELLSLNLFHRVLDPKF